LIEHGRHVEVQIFADAHGHAVYLGDRDCTTQRRRQKVIEEAPAPGLSSELRAKMGQSAVAAALAIGYTGAGTVEFMLDRDHGFHFLEMNTRLQVEHPVTELVTGLDLVALQIRIAEGKPLPLSQQAVQLRGHAMEARLYAEDPYDAFKPQTGRISHFLSQHALRQPGVRIDSGVRTGDEVSPHYDGMLAKVMAHGETRDEALRKLVRALQDAPLFGVTTNASFLLSLLRSPELERAELTTSTLDTWAEQDAPLLRRPGIPEEAWALACALLIEGRGDGFRSTGESGFSLTLSCRSERRTLRVTYALHGINVHRLDAEAPVTHLRDLTREADWCCVQVDGVFKRRVALVHEGAALIAMDGQCLKFTEPALFAPRLAAADPSQVLAPLAGKVARVMVQPGAQVEAGDCVCVIEAMKMETRVVAAASGSLRALHAQAGDQVSAGELLASLTIAQEQSPP